MYAFHENDPVATLYARLGNIKTKPAPRRGLSFQKAVGAFLFAITLCAAVASCWLIHRHAVRIPSGDEYYTVIPVLAGEKPITAHWLWQQWGEHRTPLTKLTLLEIWAIADGNQHAPMYANVALMTLMAGASMLVIRNLRGHWSFLDAAIPLLLLHLGHWENFISAWNIQNVTTATLTITLLLIAATTRSELSAGKIALVSACLWLLPLSGAGGLPITLAGAAWLIVLGYSTWPKSKAKVAALFGIAIVSVSLTAAYFVGLEAHEQSEHPATPRAFGVAFASCLSMAFGPASEQTWPRSGFFVLSLVAVAATTLLSAMRRPGCLRAFGLSCIWTGSLATVAGIAWGRGGIETSHLFFSRYGLLVAPIILGGYFASLHLDRWRAWLFQAVILSALVLSYWPNYIAAVGAADYPEHEALIADLESGMPADTLVEKHAHFLDEIFWGNDHSAERLRGFKQRHIGAFRDMAP